MRIRHDDPDRCGCRAIAIGLLVYVGLAGHAGCGGKPSAVDALDGPKTSKASPREAGQTEPETPQGSEGSKAPTQDSRSPAEVRAAVLAQAVAYQEQGKWSEATSLLRGLIVNDPQDYEVLFHLANTEAAQGNRSLAIELLDEIPNDHPEAGLPSLGVSAGWCFEIERYEDAERRYRKILEMNPTVNFARRRLAYLLNRQGRRHEAVTLIRELCRAGDVMQDELHSLIVESDAMYDPPGSIPAPGTRPYWPIGEMGQARYLFTEKRYREAAEIIQPVIESGDAPASVIAFFGRAAVEAQDDEKLAIWRGHVNDSVKEFPEYWAAIGTYLIREAEYGDAVRALAAGLRLDPTDLRSIRRLFQGLRSLDQSDKAGVWIEHYALMNRIVRASVRIAESSVPDDTTFAELASDLASVGRNLEAILWRSILATGKPNAEQLIADLNLEMKQTLADEKAFPSREQLWCGMDLGDYPLPAFPDRIASINEAMEQKSPHFVLPDTAAPVSFRDISEQIGLEHTYRNAKQPIKKAFAIYQAYGGGVAVIDFDLDGQLDLYFAQGAADPARFEADKSDQLYRTIDTAESRHLIDVTREAGTTEKDYSVGVTAGDWNQDGFPDLAVANIGINRLLINQGDGTFRSYPLDQIPELTTFSTSLAMGDVTGDRLPDLFVLNYLRDPEMARRPGIDAVGNPIEAISPLSVKPARDQLYANSAEGMPRVGIVGSDASSACTGLGLVITDLYSEHPGNEVFVANDVRNNQLWVQNDDRRLVDLAVPYGCAYGSLGSATGAMGIATADLDRTGTIDFHVTNYINEPVSLYIGRDRLFRDLNVRFNLASDSMPFVGFGTQPIDYSNDGWLDLVVTNGHIENLEITGVPFQQPIQLFVNLGDRFELIDVDGIAYWRTMHLGRALARLDFDRDGRMDFVVTDLLDRSALLLNESPTTNHWVSFRLVGTTSERDAIGAKVELQAGTQNWTSWVTAGDGYLCKNESVVHFGIGNEASIESAVVTWPSGKTQTFETIPVDRFVLLIEGESESYVLGTRARP